MKQFSSFMLGIALANLPTFARAEELDLKINTVIDKAVAEWTVLLTCTALDPPSHDFLLKSWEETKAKSAALMKAKAVDAGKIDVYLARLSALSPAVKDESPATELMKYCHAHPEWQKQMGTLEFTVPHRELAVVLGGQP